MPTSCEYFQCNYKKCGKKATRFFQFEVFNVGPITYLARCQEHQDTARLTDDEVKNEILEMKLVEINEHTFSMHIVRKVLLS